MYVCVVLCAVAGMGGRSAHASMFAGLYARFPAHAAISCQF
jgi:hypothetical protein